MKYVVKIEGQEIEVPEEVGKDDNKVKESLVAYYPQVKNALITRASKGEVTTITVVKKAGTKGAYADVLNHLVVCPESKNPAVLMYERIQREGLTDDPILLLTVENEIDMAVQQGDAMHQQMSQSLGRLIHAQAIPAPDVMVGF